jgi:hypothetical protein
VVSQIARPRRALGDLADVKDSTEEPRSYAAYNDEEAVGFDILKSTASAPRGGQRGARQGAGDPGTLPPA